MLLAVAQSRSLPGAHDELRDESCNDSPGESGDEPHDESCDESCDLKIILVSDLYKKVL